MDLLIQLLDGMRDMMILRHRMLEHLPMTQTMVTDLDCRVAQGLLVLETMVVTLDRIRRPRSPK